MIQELSGQTLRGEDGNILTYSAIDLAQPRQIRLEGSDGIEAGVDAEELEAPGPVGGDELGQKQSPEQARENLHGQWSSLFSQTARNDENSAAYRCL